MKMSERIIDWAYGVEPRFGDWLWSFKRDNCVLCEGTKGGMRGNENMVGGLVVCDYCHALLMDIKCNSCAIALTDDDLS